MNEKLDKALADPVWHNHKIGDVYNMRGRKGLWKIAYYPIFEDGKTHEVYIEPRALSEAVTPIIIDGIQGIDIVEVPLRYLTKS